MANWEDEMESWMDKTATSIKKTHPNSKPRKLTPKEIADNEYFRQERARIHQMGQDSANRMVEQIQKEEALKKAYQRSGVSKPHK